MELTTVKKGTPLYGQPSWWGDDDGDEGDDAADPGPTKKTDEKNESGQGKRSRPNSLSLSGDSPASKDKMEQHRTTYMEIPLKDDDDSESPDRGDQPCDTNTPAKSTSSTLSKDSLFSPDVKAAKGGKSVSPGVEVNPATSFTIELDDQKPRKIGINTSLSEFVPPKMRKNFRDRKDRVVSTRSNSKESTPTKNSEERELSPGQQRKIEEMWNTVEHKGKQRLSSVQATIGSSSLRSPNLEDIDLLTDLSDHDRKKPQDKDTPDKKGRRPVPSSKSPQTARSSRGKASLSSSTAATTSSTTAASVKSSSDISPAVSHSLYSDPTSYLIEKMFEGGHSSSSSKEPSPEQKLYKEAAGHDRNKSTAVLSHSNNTKVTSTKKSQKTTVVGRKSESEEAEVEEDVDDLTITEGVTDEVKEDKEDKASEAGTYTIEADTKEDEDEEEARKRIDQVFGVDVDSFVDGPNIDPKRMASPGGYDNVREDGDKTPMEGTSYFPVFGKEEQEEEDDNADVDEEDDLMVEDDEDELESPGMATAEGVQTWVSQLTALTSHKAAVSEKMMREDAGQSLSKKPPQGISRKRPGTGRKLPSIPGGPTAADRGSPVSSEHSSYLGDHPDLHIADDLSSPARSSDFMVNGKNVALTSSNGVKASRISSQPGGRGKNNGHVESPSEVVSPCSTSRSRGSMDTEILLQDTETVMAAMEARIGHRPVPTRDDSLDHDSDTDASSMVALVNGDEDYVKPTIYNSPRDALSKRRTKDAWGKSAGGVGSVPATPPSSASTKRSLGRSYSQTVSSSKTKSVASPRSTTTASGTKKSVVSDVYSRTESVDNDSVISDVGSDVGEGNLSRNGSKGKGGIAMTMTKPNRAFQLRRARADSFEEPTTPRSAKSTGRTNTTNGGSSVRSSSVHTSSRRSNVTDSHRSEASLGGQIVRKSRENAQAEKAKSSSNLTRADGGRHSLRLNRATSLTVSQTANNAAADAAKKRETTPKREYTPKSHLKSSGTNNNSRGNLSVTGVSSNSLSSRSQSQSQPGSRSNSPKAAERMAWQRRKQYDPRRAVAEAKAKSKDSPGSVSGSSTASTTSYGVTARPKPSASSNYKRRMIRSASFTNSQELQLSVQSALSSSQDYVGEPRHEHEGFRRAFIPFHNSLRTDRSAFSADEDDSILSATSTQASYDTLIVSSIYQLSLKLKTATDKTMIKLRESDRLSMTPSPIDDFLSDSGKSEITAWKSANQELAGVLKNLRRIERHVSVIDRVLFPEDDNDTDVSTALPVGQNYVQEIERIRNEIKGFQPIEPHDHEVASPEMAELSGTF